MHNDCKKIYRAKTPRTQREKYFSELGALCVFARVILSSFESLQTAEEAAGVQYFLRIEPPLDLAHQPQACRGRPPHVDAGF